jgi:hypothetical protein
MIFKANVAGSVPYAGPVGPQPTVPPGPCTFEPHDDTVTLAWVDGDAHCAAVISRDEFDRHVKNRAIVVLS